MQHSTILDMIGTGSLLTVTMARANFDSGTIVRAAQGRPPCTCMSCSACHKNISNKIQGKELDWIDNDVTTRGKGPRPRQGPPSTHTVLRHPLPEFPKHTTPTTRNRIGGAAQQEPDALLDGVADGPHRRRVEHVRARLRERVWVQARALEVALVDGRLARAGHQAGVNRGLERAARRAQTVEDLSRSD